MKGIVTIFLILNVVFAFKACQEAPPALPSAAQDFLPAVEQLQDGVLHEYIARFDQGPNKEVQGQLDYSFYKLSADGKNVSITGMTPAFKPTLVSTLGLSDSMLNLQFSERYSRQDTFTEQIITGELIRFDGKAATLEIKSTSWQSTRQLKQVADTVWRGRRAQRFIGSEIGIALENGAKDTAQLERLYVADLGVVLSKAIRSNSTYSRELIRQLSPKQYADLKASVPKRVAYIDPAKTLIPDIKDWAPCRDDALIADYYNPTPDIGYPGGHYALERDLLPQIDLMAFAGESGYLTIRFVTNCQGELGRFTSDEADLNFKPKLFPPAAVRDVALAVQTLTGWSTGRTRPGEPLADFYTYITLKFEDGKLIDFLP